MEYLSHLLPVSPALPPDCCQAPPVQTFHAVIGGITRTWHIFFPSSYDGTRLLPLLVTLHGNGGYKPERNPWHYTAQRAGFVVVYPEAVRPFQWNIWGIKTAQGAPDDIAFLDYIFEEILEKYALDPTRIYLHGQSMGDNMATYYAYERGERLAALAVTSGPTLPSVAYTSEGGYRFSPRTALPVARVHGDLDHLCGLPSTYGVPKSQIAQVLSGEEQAELRRSMEETQISLWKAINETTQKPRLYFDDRRNIQWYPGRKADLIYYTIADGVHRPFADTYDMLWDEVLCRYQNVGGKHVKAAVAGFSPGGVSALANTLMENDSEADILPSTVTSMVAAVEGCNYIYRNMEVHQAPGIELEIRDHVLYGTLEFIRQGFPDIRISQADEGMSAILERKEKCLQLAAGHNLVLVNGHVRPTAPVEAVDRRLMLPLSQIIPLLVPSVVQIRERVVCFADHPFILTRDGAGRIRQMLTGEQIPEKKEALKLEEAIKRKLGR